jgi:hypothetical protein
MNIHIRTQIFAFPKLSIKCFKSPAAVLYRVFCHLLVLKVGSGSRLGPGMTQKLDRKIRHCFDCLPSDPCVGGCRLKSALLQLLHLLSDALEPNAARAHPEWHRYLILCGWDLAAWLERLTANAVVATVLGSIPASSDTVVSEGRPMKQCWMSYIKRKNPKISPIHLMFWTFFYFSTGTNYGTLLMSKWPLKMFAFRHWIPSYRFVWDGTGYLVFDPLFSSSTQYIDRNTSVPKKFLQEKTTKWVA